MKLRSARSSACHWSAVISERPWIASICAGLKGRSAARRASRRAGTVSGPETSDSDSRAGGASRESEVLAAGSVAAYLPVSGKVGTLARSAAAAVVYVMGLIATRELGAEELAMARRALSKGRGAKPQG